MKNDKNTTRWDITRSFVFSNLTNVNQLNALKHLLSNSVGVKTYIIDIDKRQIVVIYDARKTSYEVQLSYFINLGLQSQNSFWQGWLRTWYKFIDNNIRENAKVPLPVCCNRAPSIRKH